MPSTSFDAERTDTPLARAVVLCIPISTSRRFFTRLSEYSHMWKAVALASKRYQSSETGKNGQHSAIAQQYQAIENGDARNENGTSSVGHMRQPSFDQGGMEIEEMPSL